MTELGSITQAAAGEITLIVSEPAALVQLFHSPARMNAPMLSLRNFASAGLLAAPAV